MSRLPFEKEEDRDLLDIGVTFIEGLIVILGLLCFLALLTWMQHRDLEDQVETHKTESRRVTSMLADCMNGKPLFDYATNTAYFCDRAIAVKNP